MNDDRNVEQVLKASDDPVRQALLRASLLEPESLSVMDEAAIDEALRDDSDISHAEALELFKR